MIEVMILKDWLEKKKKATQILSDGEMDGYTIGVLEVLRELELMMDANQTKK